MGSAALASPRPAHVRDAEKAPAEADAFDNRMPRTPYCRAAARAWPVMRPMVKPLEFEQ